MIEVLLTSDEGGVTSRTIETAPAAPDLEAALLRCAAGDRTALRAIYEEEAGRMLGVALRMLRRRALAEEIVQDCFVQVWRKAASFDPRRGTARGWLYAMLRNRTLNLMRQEARVDLVEDYESFGLESAEESPAEIVMRLSETDKLRRCLETLEATRRHAIVLAYTQGLSHGELAGRLGMPLGTVKSWIRRSLLALRECMA